MNESWRVEVFYDGLCPLCLKEINMLRWMDKKRGNIRFTDIAAPDFDAEKLGTTFDDLMARIHGRLPSGEWIEGVEVFRQLYSAVGFAPLVWLTRIPGISHAMDWGYRVFAKNRLKWTGRCVTDGENSCSLENNEGESGSHPTPAG